MAMGRWLAHSVLSRNRRYSSTASRTSNEILCTTYSPAVPLEAAAPAQPKWRRTKRLAARPLQATASRDDQPQLPVNNFFDPDEPSCALRLNIRFRHLQRRRAPSRGGWHLKAAPWIRSGASGWSWLTDWAPVGGSGGWALALHSDECTAVETRLTAAAVNPIPTAWGTAGDTRPALRVGLEQCPGTTQQPVQVCIGQLAHMAKGIDPAQKQRLGLKHVADASSQALVQQRFANGQLTRAAQPTPRFGQVEVGP